MIRNGSNSGQDLAACDREPIHIPGAIQPHGVMLVADAGLVVTHGAGDVAGKLGIADWVGAPLARLLGAEAATAISDQGRAGRGTLRGLALAGGLVDMSFHRSGGHVIVELEDAGAPSVSAALLPHLESAAAGFERTATLEHLHAAAAAEFRQLTGYDRVMIYRFVEGDAGVVVAEDKAHGQSSFLHHHFPASDIPRQARALYVRNLVRVIPDVNYVPAPLTPPWTGAEPLDMSDSMLRSVSPVHIQYLKNMGVGASASFSVVKDGALWGLIACHSEAPTPLSLDVRAACRALAGALARQIRAREETDAYRERVRLRSYEDDIVALLLREGSLDAAISSHVDEIRQMLDGDGVAVLRGDDLVTGGRHPQPEEIRRIAQWCRERAVDQVFATDRLGSHLTVEGETQRRGAGLLAVTLSASEPWIVMWFRSEEVEVVEWAGNPHKNVIEGANGVLNPRASFAAWSETVRGRSRRWTIPEIEAAARLRTAVMEVWQTRRIRDLNRQLLDTLDQKDMLIRQKEFLIGEVNHRVQNSLQLVSSFLALQSRSAEEPALRDGLEEARRRIGAVSLVHRRLYRADQLETIDASRYLDELLDDLFASFGSEWSSQLLRDFDPVMLPADRAVGLGLVATELVINANKYAYGGASGPLRLTLGQDRGQFRLTVEDQGVGRSTTRKGFGSRMMDSLVGQLGGTLAYEETTPGSRAVLTAPISPP